MEGLAAPKSPLGEYLSELPLLLLRLVLVVLLVGLVRRLHLAHLRPLVQLPLPQAQSVVGVLVALPLVDLG